MDGTIGLLPNHRVEIRFFQSESLYERDKCFLRHCSRRRENKITSVLKDTQVSCGELLELEKRVVRLASSLRLKQETFGMTALSKKISGHCQHWQRGKSGPPH